MLNRTTVCKTRSGVGRGRSAAPESDVVPGPRCCTRLPVSSCLEGHTAKLESVVPGRNEPVSHQERRTQQTGRTLSRLGRSVLTL